MDSEKLIFAAIGGLTIVILAVIVLTSFKSSVSQTPESVIGDAPIYKGVEPSKAKLTIVEFSDFECPYCSQYPPILSELVKQYPNELSVIYRHFPLPMHTGSVPAAQASEAANIQGKFWEYHDELFKNQPNFTSDDLIAYAETVGLDIEKFKQDLSSEDVKRKVKEDSETAGKLKLNSTPSFYIINDGKVEKVAITSVTSLGDKVKEILGESKVTEDIPSDTNNLPDQLIKKIPENNNQSILDTAKLSLLTTLGKDGIDKEIVKVINWSEEEWNDSSLECPQESMSYSQVITPGYKLDLEYQGAQYEYHTDKNGKVVNCTK
jgi:protein-disulfide isomerase